MIGLVPLSAGILLIAEIGIILLLFEIGLETDLQELLKVPPPLLASLARAIPSAVLPERVRSRQ